MFGPILNTPQERADHAAKERGTAAPKIMMNGLNMVVTPDLAKWCRETGVPVAWIALGDTSGMALASTRRWSALEQNTMELFGMAAALQVLARTAVDRVAENQTEREDASGLAAVSERIYELVFELQHLTPETRPTI